MGKLVVVAGYEVLFPGVVNGPVEAGSKVKVTSISVVPWYAEWNYTTFWSEVTDTGVNSDDDFSFPAI